MECLRTCWLRLGTFRGVWGRVEGVMVRFGVRGRRLGGVLGVSWGLLGGSWVPLGATCWCPKSALDAFRKFSKPCILRGVWALSYFVNIQHLCFGPFCNRNGTLKGLGGDLGSLGSLLGASWGLWGRFWAPKGPPGGILGPPWGILGPPWGLLGASLGPLGASWRPPGGLLGATLGAQKGPRRLLTGTKNHGFYKGFGRFCVFRHLLQKIRR